MPYHRFSPQDVGICLSTLTPNPRAVSERDVEAMLHACSACGFRSIAMGANYGNITGIERLRQLISDLELEVRVIEAITSWTEGAETSQAETRAAAEFAAATGADILMAATIAQQMDFERAVEGLAAACKMADDRGLRVALEFIPNTAVPDLKTAWRLVNASGSDNAGLVIDCLHWLHQPGGPDVGLLRRIPPERIHYVQLCDSPVATAPAGAQYIPFAMTDRAAPGEGVVDIGELIGELESMGAEPFYALEVFNSALAASGPVNMARQLWRAIQ
jgi:sugar phosphate isomerase/epimerase